MDYRNEEKRLLKFIATSAFFLSVGTIHGVVQMIRPVRAYLDSIGSPYGGPGHMIDPLAHAHMNLIGGVILTVMAVSYYLIPRITGKGLYSYKLLDHTYWWTSLGLLGFYSTLMVFGIWEGNLMLAEELERMEEVHSIYTKVIATVATVMGMGFWIYFFNIYKSFRKVSRSHD